jgi:hypothetical protein
MAKGFPFFKFVSAKWLAGSIVLEDLETQGLFINICALYWERDGDLSLEDINRRFKNPSCLNRLFGYFIQESNGSISIEFLDEQLKDANHTSIKNSENGKKSAEKRNKLNGISLTTVKRPLNDPLTTVEQSKVNKKESKVNKIKEEGKEQIFYQKFDHLSITFEEFDKLISFGHSKEKIDDCIESIKNYKKNTNYKSLFLTTKKWLKLDSDRKLEKNGTEKNRSTEVVAGNKIYGEL